MFGDDVMKSEDDSISCVSSLGDPHSVKKWRQATTTRLNYRLFRQHTNGRQSTIPFTDEERVAAT